MELIPKEISEGKHNGKTVWVTDYRIPTIGEKPIRVVPPTKVLIRSNTEIKEKVYYSESHFAPLNKAGLPTSKIIKLFDNTGYRSFPGTPLHVFDTEAEAIACYKNQCAEILSNLETWYTSQGSFYRSLKAELTASL
jgi:hypothetical protein